ncbi:interleukin-7 receptor subunit alpha, partial [Aplochiton taeniatus]
HECFTEPGNNVTSKKLENIIVSYNVTLQLKGGDTFTKSIDLRKIVKPKSPWVVNATFHHKSNRAEIHIGNRYLKNYLQPDKQLFELHLWSDRHTLNFNITSGPLFIEGEYLRKDTEYHVKVRAIPTGGYFEGFWSDWSTPLSFITHSGKDYGSIYL